MKLVDQINHKLRHLRLIAAAASFVEYQKCEDCKREASKVSTPKEVSTVCDCGSLTYWRIEK